MSQRMADGACSKKFKNDVQQNMHVFVKHANMTKFDERIVQDPPAHRSQKTADGAYYKNYNFLYRESSLTFELRDMHRSSILAFLSGLQALHFHRHSRHSWI